MLLLRGATLAAGAATSVSIHAPLARSNDRSAARRSSVFRFQHAPLARSNPSAKDAISSTVFQYMLLLRGATWRSSRAAVRTQFQYMLLLRGATCNQAGQPGRNKFQYMLLLRGATGCAYPPSSKWSVSIHTPLARSNGSSWHQGGRVKCFNTCSSCEEQPGNLIIVLLVSLFQYMLLLRGATRILAISPSAPDRCQYMLRT